MNISEKLVMNTVHSNAEQPQALLMKDSKQNINYMNRFDICQNVNEMGKRLKV